MQSLKTEPMTIFKVREIINKTDMKWNETFTSSVELYSNREKILCKKKSTNSTQFLLNAVHSFMSS